jgi:hypothetical protein
MHDRIGGGMSQAESLLDSSRGQAQAPPPDDVNHNPSTL